MKWFLLLLMWIKDKIMHGFKPSAGCVGNDSSDSFGNNIGTSVTSTQSTAIANGTFTGISVGDYWKINNIKYRIVHLDYYYGKGDTPCTTHHVVVMPVQSLIKTQMNSTATSAGHYGGSLMYSTNIADARSTIQTAFGSHLLTIRQYFDNGSTLTDNTSGFWTNADVWLPTLYNISPSLIGTYISTSYNNYSNWLDSTVYDFFSTTESKKSIGSSWLRDVCSSRGFACVSSGSAAEGIATQNLDVKPAFCVK